MSYLEQEIAEQPDVIRNLLDAERDNVAKIVTAIREFNPHFVNIAARGTSDNAARYAQYLFGVNADIPVALAAPSIHTLYQSPPNLSRAVVIGVSQSGSAADVAQVLKDAREQGALTIAITNKPESLLAQTAEYHIALHAGDEISVAATKTYTAQLTVMAMLGVELADNADMRNALQSLPDDVAKTLELSTGIADWTQRYRYMNHFSSIGRGYNYCTAFEISLKVKELCYVIGHGYSEADYLHGPIAMLQRGFPVIVTAPAGKTFGKMQEFLQTLKEREAESLVISNDESAFEHAQQAMRIQASTPEWLTPITAVIPGQIFAMNLAIAKGNPIDKPRGLNKVTVTT